MNLLGNLNPPQLKAVEHTDGPLLVLAGAGSGKTRVITYRVAHLVYNTGVAPNNILAVTFTNKAAEEMKERILRLRKSPLPSPITPPPILPPQVGEGEVGETRVRNHMNGVWIGTFHSICLRLLRRHSQAVGYRNDFYIHDKSDQWAHVKECLKELNINKDLYPVNSIVRGISYLKSRLITPHEFSQMAKSFGMDDKLSKVYRLYQDRLARQHIMDFDDLIMKCVELFEKDSEILSRYQDIFRYILVDEYQDINPAQYKLIRLLADKHRNLCVVGDDDQSIYRFRGAELQNILSFEVDYPSAMVIRLEQNYRSTGSILDVAGSVINKNMGRRRKRLWTKNPPGEPAVYHRAIDEREEANYVARCIRSLIKDGERPGHIAVFYRTNAQSRVIEEVLIGSGLPYIIIGGFKFYERREVKDILAYIKVSLRPDDDVSLRRIINVPHRGIGSSTMKAVEEYARLHGLSLYEGALKMSAETRRLEGFIALIEKLRVLVAELPPSEFVRRIFEWTGYIEALGKDNIAEERIENLMELRVAIKRYEERVPGMGIAGFLDEASLLSEPEEIANPKSQTLNRVTLMTLHSAKGLEFPVVFITGLEEGLLPHAGSLGSKDDIEEERRLCYVGMTRAMEKLYLTGVVRRNIFGQSLSRKESRFIRGIKMDHKIKIEIGGARMYNDKFSDANMNVVMDKAGQFTAGDRVHHPLWGIGIVESSEGSGEREKVVVKFDSVGAKTLATRFARLEVV
ncbi:MAG: DUF3553 domain-containing protein [Thermodesulfobacteriota bacterium]